ncbi:MAG: hypothetical protein GX802_06610 [Clostridiales bacterium]|jgi:hypothetical protein|nr:hypothetical protein [Clostridiales bacterium]
MKRIIVSLFIVVALVMLVACNNITDGEVNPTATEGIQNTDEVGNTDEVQNTDEVENSEEPANGNFSLIKNEYKDKHELYAFVQSFLDYKKPAAEAIEAKYSEFEESVANLAYDFGIDITIQPIVSLRNLEKEGDSWEGTASTYDYEIHKEGDVYTFSFVHTMLETTTEGTCDVKAGTLQLTAEITSGLEKYQIIYAGEGAYLRFWSEKSDYLDYTRAHYTYFKGLDIAMGQEETNSPKELIGASYNDHTYAENDDAWVKFISGQTSSFDGINN